jgi:hypothetical protein
VIQRLKHWGDLRFSAEFPALVAGTRRAPVYPSLWAAYKEIIPAILRQLNDQEYYVRRELLPGAARFNEPTPLNDGRALPLAPVTAA